MLQFWLFLIISFSLIFIVVGITIFLSRFRKIPHIKYLLTYLICTTIWIFTSVMEVLSQSEGGLHFWSLLGATFGIFTIAWMLIFIFYYLDNHITTWTLVLFLGMAVVFSVARWTNSFHYLFFTSLTIQEIEGAILLDREYGPLFAVMICIDTVIILFAIFKIFQHRQMSHQIFQRQINVFAYFIIIMIAFNLLSALNISISYLPLFALFAVMPGLSFTLAAMRKNNITMIPLRRVNYQDIIDDAITVISNDGIILDLNQEMSALILKNWSHAVGNPLQSIYPDLALRVDEIMQSTGTKSEPKTRPGKFRFLFRTDEKQYDTAIYDCGNHNLIVMHDITPLMRSLNNTNQLAHNDGLTGIHNRRSFESAVRQWLDLHRNSDCSFCFALFDVDHFKQFNDTYGHQVGDEVLKKITEIFTRSIRTSDLFGRFGGDEFILFLGDVTEKQTKMILERALLKISREQLTTESGTMLSPTISMGAVFSPASSSFNYDEIFSFTDEALYTAKENGRNQICFRVRSPLSFDESLY